MKKVTSGGAEIDYYDLDDSTKLEIYRKNKERYFDDFVKYGGKVVRTHAEMDNEKQYLKVYNQMIRDEIEGKEEYVALNRIFGGRSKWKNTSDFIYEPMVMGGRHREIKQNFEYREDIERYRYIKKDFLEKLNWGQHPSEIDRVLEEETIKAFASSKEWRDRIIAAILSKDSELLNKLYRDEVNQVHGNTSRMVRVAIYQNDSFEREEETEKILWKSNSLTDRWIAATQIETKNSRILNEIVKKEIKRIQNGKHKEKYAFIITNYPIITQAIIKWDFSQIAYMIFSNRDFKMEPETRKQLTPDMEEHWEIVERNRQWFPQRMKKNRPFRKKTYGD